MSDVVTEYDRTEAGFPYPGLYVNVPFSILLAPVSARAVHLYVLLCSEDEDEDLSRAYLANELGCTVKTIDRAARELEDVGLLVRHHQMADNGQIGNRWEVRA